MPAAFANGYTWNYTIIGIFPNQTVSIGTGGSGSSNATTITTGISGEVIIPGTLDGKPVTSIGQYAFEGSGLLTSVTFPSSVRIISNDCFLNCISLVKADLPNALTSIGFGAFLGTKLSLVDIPNSVTSLGGSVFQSCSSLTSVTIGTSVTIISNSIFESCSSLTSVTIPNSVTTISSGAFKNCSTLSSVTIGTSVTTLDSGVFEGCSYLNFINIPNSVTTIGVNAFKNSALVSATIGTSVKTIDLYAFERCSSLISINIPDSVTFIGTNAFLNTSTNLTVTMNTGKFGKTSPSFDQTFFGGTSVNFVLPPPDMTVTSTTSGVTSGSTTKNTPIALRFTSSQSTTSFVVGDISVTNGTLSAFAGSGSVYNATFTPTSQGVCTINVAPGVYTAAGGNNTASNTFTFTFDAAPSMIITSTIASGSTTNIASIPLTFTATEAITGFQAGDISFNRGSLTGFDGSGSVYTATFTSTIQGAYTINVPVNAYIDATGNSNTTASTFNWTYNSPPNITITSNIANNATSNKATIPLTFTASKAITGFQAVDISFNRGTLTDLSGSGTVYTATFTHAGEGAYTINVPVGAYIDATGNSNTTASTFNWTYDNTKPDMIITATASGSNLASGSTTKNTPIELTFTASEVPTGFEYADISFNGGTLSPLTGSDTVYTATFTPNQSGVSGKTECSISVPADKFTDAVGNSNTVSNTFNFTFDNTKPDMIITATASGSNLASGSTTKNTPIELTFTASEVPTGFEYADISFNGGTLSPLAGGGSVYTATFTPDENGVSGKTECSISVPADKFTDDVGNFNSASNTFIFTFDNTKPDMIITATASGSNITSGSTTKNTPIELTFTASEVITGFEYADISFNGGTLSSLTGSDTVYTATFTPNQSGVSGKTECSISVPADKFVDNVGNFNSASNTFIFTFDNTKPDMIITATASGSNLASGSTTKNTPIELTFTASEVPTGFEYADISFNGGTLSPLTGSDTVYTATFTPNQSGVSGKTECSISVPADKFTDDVGNFNSASNTFIFTFDNTKPDMIITATASGSNITSGSTTKNTPIELTFTASEVITGFEYADISFNGGTLSPLSGDGSVYTATFTPDENGVSGKTECSIYVSSDKFTDDVGNSNAASNTFNFTFDNTKPDMIITATASGSNLASGSATKNTPIELTFTASEVITGFEYADISFNGGTLSPLTGSDTVYTATFTPNQSGVTGKTECSISVPADKFTDAVGNFNSASNTFIFTFDNTKPDMIITATASGSNITSGSTTKNTPIELTFTASEAITGFEYADISFNGGTLSPLTGSDAVYTATFTPNQSGVSGISECSISVPADKFTDAVGNSNAASNTFNFTFDNTKPSMTITATASGSNLASGSTTKNTPIELTFTATEVITGFEYADISFNGGTLSPLTGSDTVYTATFTPDENGVSGKTECSISVPADKFVDDVGNYNNASNIFTFTFDNTKPGMIITATASGSAITSGSTTKNAPIELTFTAPESITGFEYADISFNGGTLSSLTGSDTVYTATFTPNQSGVSGKTECSISVPADKFTDAVGNSNAASNTFNFTFDNTKPDMIITATASGSNITSGSTTKNAPIELTFTASEAITGFEYADISFNGGTLSPLTGSDTVYTATFTPNQSGISGKTECSISVSADKFIDAVGNYNAASNTFTFTFDNTKPGMIITATSSGSTLDSGSTTKNTPIELTFTASEAITDFEYADISFNGGTLSPLTGSDTVYTATFTPDENDASGKTECSISVPADKFTDAVGNSNTASNTFNFTFDNTKPGMVITATAGGSNLDSGSTTKNAPIELIFTLSEVSTDFEYADISFNGGTLSPLSGDGSVYTATFTPNQSGVSGKTECSISVPADKFTDAVGNSNTASNTFNFTFDNTKPGMIITATAGGSNLDSGSTTKNAPIALTFTLSEVSTDFEYADISFNGGTLSPLTGSDTVYTATFTPNQSDVSGKTECSISVPADKFTDAVGNFNSASNTFNFTFDNTKPGMVITATSSGSNITSGSTTKNAPIVLTFTASEVITGFEYEDISFNGGTLSTVTGSDTVYTATFTPDENDVSGKTECSISVPADKFTDVVGNSNTASNTFNFTFDNTKPGMIITATAGGSNIDSGSTTKNAPIALTFTAPESITGFDKEHISVTGGTLSPLTGSDTVYTATFTPDENGVSGKTECSISVPADKFTDAVGNSNTASNTFNFTFDNTKPDMIITATAGGSNLDSGSTTKNAPIELIFTLSEVSTDFEYADISFNGGTLSAVNGSGTVYTATFTPDENDVSGKTECSISVPADKFTDAVGNYNTASNTFNFTFDNTKPGMIITATASGSNITSGSTTKNRPIALTFTATEVPTGFEYADISFNGGTLSTVTGSDTVYTATFTPDENGVSGKTECSISVPADKFTDAVGNFNSASNTFNFTFDNTKPGMIITATAGGSNLDSGSTTKNAPIALTFTASEAITGFEYADISFNGGTLSPLTGSDTVYTATFTPNQSDVSGKTECSISVLADKFTDAAGNNNIASNTFTFTFDSVRPTMTITSTTPGVVNNAITNNASIELTFTSSEPTNNFVKESIAFTNGTLPFFTAISDTVYTATFIPTGPGPIECTINVAEGLYADVAGNVNTEAAQFTLTFDSIPPDMTITSTTPGITIGSITDAEIIELTFTSTKATNNFVVENISVTNGVLTNFAGIGTDGTVYTATFTPTGSSACIIDVAAGAYTDAAGNSNNAATTFNWTFRRNMSFDTNTLTITNNIGANATDIILFVLPYGEEMSNIIVTAFAGTGVITYDLSTYEATVSSGTFTGTGTNLLGTNALIASTNTTYILTLTANASITYTIVGTKRVNYGNVSPTALSFVNNNLTIQNSIVSTEVDKVSFDLDAGSLLYSLEVTSLLNTNSISYVLDISGGSTLSSGSFTQAGVNLLNQTFIQPDVDTTYILTLTCPGANTYSILGMSEGKFDINKFCSKQGIACNNVGYNRLVTTNNDPSISNKMRYSQLLRTRRFKQIQVPGLRAPPLNTPQPLYLFSTGQIFTRSAIPNLRPLGPMGPVCPNR